LVQVQIVDEGFYTNIDLKTIHSFDSILDEIKQFLEKHSLDLPVIRDIESLDFLDSMAERQLKLKKKEEQIKSGVLKNTSTKTNYVEIFK
jgi:hypothetical protein